MFQIVALLRQYGSFDRNEVMDMTYLDVEHYILFYAEAEVNKINSHFRSFCLFNSESTAMGYLSVMSKNGTNVLGNYCNTIQKREKLDAVENDEENEDVFDNIEDQFK